MTIPPPPPGRFDDDAPLDDPDNDNAEVSNVIKFNGWRQGLLCNDKGKIKNLEHNVYQILRFHPDWSGCIAYDEFASNILLRKSPPYDPASERGPYPRKWIDQDTTATMAWLQGTRRALVDASRSVTDGSVMLVAHRQSFHPVRDYLGTLKWDGEQRLPRFLTRYLGAPDTPYAAQVGTAWLISAIARVMRPGCQADYMLVLEGNQGKRKSTALRELFSDEWFSDARLTMNDEGLKKLRGKWGMEIPELEGFRGKAASEIKAFITSRIDHYRESYGRHPKDFPRTCVFAGTTNEREYLIDRTGNRRFWPVLCGDIALEALRDDRDQIWAEALTRFQCKENWWLEDEADAREEQRKREVREPWFELITAWLVDPTVPDGTHGARRRINLEQGFTIAEAMQGALNLRAADMQREAQTRVGFCLHKLGFEAHRVQRDGSRERRYFKRGTFMVRSPAQQ